MSEQSIGQAAGTAKPKVPTLPDVFVSTIHQRYPGSDDVTSIMMARQLPRTERGEPRVDAWKIDVPPSVLPPLPLRRVHAGVVPYRTGILWRSVGAVKSFFCMIGEDILHGPRLDEMRDELIMDDRCLDCGMEPCICFVSEEEVLS